MRLEQLLHDALGLLAPEGQRLIADAAERAVRARAPPAPARALVEQRHAGGSSAAAGDAASRVEVGVVARRRAVVERDRIAAFRDGHRALALAVAQPGLRAAGTAGQEVLDEPGQHALALAADDGVDPGKRAVQRRAHDALTVGATEDDADVGPASLETPGQRQRGGSLVGAGGEADHGRRRGGERLGPAVEERRHERAEASRDLDVALGDRVLAEPPDVAGVVVLRGLGEDPVAEADVARQLHHEVVVGDAEPLVRRGPPR